MEFEWDSEKEAASIIKHGINFYTAERVFLDPNKIILYDNVHSSINEDRYHAIGMVNRVLTVVYTERGDVTRIISARCATKKERRYYYEYSKTHIRKKQQTDG